MLECRVSTVVGGGRAGDWVGVESGEVGRGEVDWWHMVVAVREEGEQYVDLSGFGKEVVQKVWKELKLGIVGVEGLVRVVEKVVEEAGTVGVELVGVGLVDNQAWVVVNRGEVGLYRGGKLGRVLESEGEVRVVVGEVREGDVLLLGTENFFEGLGYQQLLARFLGREMVEDLEERVRVVGEGLVVEVERSRGVGMGAVVVGVGGKRKRMARWLGVKSGIWNIWERVGKWRGKRGARKVFLRRERKERKRLMGIVLAIVGLLLVSVGWGWRMRQRQVVRKQLEEELVGVGELVEDSRSEAGINRAYARELMIGARAEYEQVREKYEGYGWLRERLEEVAGEIEEGYVAVSGEMAVTPTVFMDLELVEEGFLGDKMTLSGEELLVLDPSGMKVMRVGVENKQAELVASGEILSGGKWLGGDEKYGYVWVNEGILRIDWEAKEGEVVIETDEVWEDVGAVGGYADRVYVLDRSLGELWRYREVEDGDWVRQRWLAPGIAPIFNEVVDMVIDGDIWVLDRGGQVRQYVQGASVGFATVGFDEVVESCCLGVGEGVVVLDRRADRLVVFDREGKYERQMLWDQLGAVSDMVVYENRILLLLGSEVYELGW